MTVKKYVPSVIPSTPKPAKPHTKSFDFCSLQNIQPCKMFVNKFGSEKIAIAVGTSNNIERDSTAIIGTPAPVAPFNIRPKPKERKAIKMGKTSKRFLSRK